MILKAIIEEQVYELNVPEALIDQAQEFFDKMDQDMDQGWQMDREWVPNPDAMQRCQIVSDKLLTALENEDHNLGRLMAGYILARLPDIESLELDPSGEIQAHRANFKGTAPAPGGRGIQFEAPPNPEAMAQAQREVSKVFKQGRQYRFSFIDPETGSWVQSAAIGDQETAETLREAQVRKRYSQLNAPH